MKWRLAVWCVAVLLALGQAAWRLSQPVPVPKLPALLQGHPPLWVWGRIDSLTRQGPTSLRFVFEVHGVIQPGLTQPHSVLAHRLRVWVTWSHTSSDSTQAHVWPGEMWLLPLAWRQIPVEPLPGGFDPLRWMQQQELSGWANVMRLPGSEQARRLRVSDPGLQSWRQAMREGIFQAIDHPRWAGLVAALSMGDQNAVEAQDWDTFRRTGVAHLVSISGLHVTLLASWLAWVVDAMWRRVRWQGQPCALWWPAPCLAQGVAWVTAGVYALFSGWGLPAQRTVWMLLASLGLRLVGRSWPPHVLWLSLIACIAALDPWALSQSGFWLSYVAVGVLYLMEPTRESGAWRKWWTETLGVQWRITIALTPMSLYFFQGTSLAGLWVNLWAIPWVTCVVTPLSLLGLLCPSLWVAAGWAAGWLLMGLDAAALTPWALIETRAPSGWSVAPATVCTVLAVMPGPWLWRAWCVSLAWALLSVG